MARVILRDVSVSFRAQGSSRSARAGLLGAFGVNKSTQSERNQDSLEALSSVCLTISDGDRVGLMGANGSGKTTLLRAIGEIYKPTSGSLVVEGSICSLIDISLGMNPEISGLENIFLRAGLLGISQSTIKAQLSEIVAFSGLEDRINDPIRTYSSGMLLRLSFATSVAFYRDIVLMDEWLSVGDIDFHQRAEQKIVSLIGASQILVFASHSREQLEKVCNRGVVLNRGRVIFDGKIDEATTLYFGPR